MLEARELLREPPEHEARLTLGDLRVYVRSNDAELAKRLASYFEPFGTAAVARANGATGAPITINAIQGEHHVTPDGLRVVEREPGRAPKEAYRDVERGRIALKLRTNVAYFIEPGATTIVGDLRKNFSQAVNIVGLAYAEHYIGQGYAMVHASAVSGSRGIAFVGTSGRGKSTMALALIERGARYVSNDRVLLRDRGERVDMVGVPKMPRVNPGTLMRLPSLRSMISDPARLAGLDPLDLWRLEEKHDVVVGSAVAGSVELRGHLDQMWSLRWAPDATGWSVQRLAPEQIADRLATDLKALGVLSLIAPRWDAWREACRAIAHRVEGHEVTGRADVELLAQTVAPSLT